MWSADHLHQPPKQDPGLWAQMPIPGPAPGCGTRISARGKQKCNLGACFSQLINEKMCVLITDLSQQRVHNINASPGMAPCTFYVSSAQRLLPCSGNGTDPPTWRIPFSSSPTQMYSTNPKERLAAYPPSELQMGIRLRPGHLENLLKDESGGPVGKVPGSVPLPSHTTGNTLMTRLA